MSIIDVASLPGPTMNLVVTTKSGTWREFIMFLPVETAPVLLKTNRATVYGVCCLGQRGRFTDALEEVGTQLSNGSCVEASTSKSGV